MSIGSWIAYPNPISDPKLRLFCVPHAGAGISAFRSWFHKMDSGVELAMVRLPGRESRHAEAPCTDLLDLVERLTDELTPTLTKPFAIFGHCLGGLVAFELARHLRRRGAPRPLLLCVSNCRAPHTPRSGSAVSSLPTEQFVMMLRQLGGTPEEILDDPDARDLVLPTLRADFALSENYRYYDDDPFDFPIHVITDTVQNTENWSRHTNNRLILHILSNEQAVLLPTGASVISDILSGRFRNRL